MPPSQFVKFHNLAQIVAAFCGSQRPARIRTIDRDSEGFSGAVVLRVVVEGTKLAPEAEYCLRGWPPDSLQRDRLAGLHRLLEHIHRCGVKQVPVPLKSQFGTTLYTEAGQFWQLEPWLPGQADFSSAPTDVRLQNSMTVLAQWHDAAARFEARSSEAEWFKQVTSATSPTVEDRLVRIHRFYTTDVAKMKKLVADATMLDGWNAEFLELKSLSRQILNFFVISAPHVGEELLSYRDMRLRLHPCLRDVWHDHILFEGDEVTGLIDPNAARCETPATDLARLLGSFLRDDDDRWEMAMAAYRSVRPLSDREAKLARVLDQSTTLLSGLTWLERLFVHRENYSNPARVIARLRQITSRIERLAYRLQTERIQSSTR
jgi:Ser/Thr protein kinase RdoA (MazF antagonist)